MNDTVPCSYYDRVEGERLNLAESPIAKYVGEPEKKATKVRRWSALIRLIINS